MGWGSLELLIQKQKKLDAVILWQEHNF